jgi:hypothetical protein
VIEMAIRLKVGEIKLRGSGKAPYISIAVWIAKSNFRKYCAFFIVKNSIFFYNPNELKKLHWLTKYEHRPYSAAQRDKDIWNYHHISDKKYYNYYKIKFETNSVRTLEEKLGSWFRKAKIKFKPSKDIKETIDALISAEMLEAL